MAEPETSQPVSRGAIGAATLGSAVAAATLLKIFVVDPASEERRRIGEALAEIERTYVARDVLYSRCVAYANRLKRIEGAVKLPDIGFMAAADCKVLEDKP